MAWAAEIQTPSHPPARRQPRWWTLVRAWNWWAPPCISEDWGVRGRRRKLGLEVSRPESLLPVCREVTASECCSGEGREAMATSGKLAKGLRPPSLCPHGAYWPWLKIVQFLHCCCHWRPAQNSEGLLAAAHATSRGLELKGFTQLSNPPQTEAGGCVLTMCVCVAGWGVQKKQAFLGQNSVSSPAPRLTISSKTLVCLVSLSLRFHWCKIGWVPGF